MINLFLKHYIKRRNEAMTTPTIISPNAHKTESIEFVRQTSTSVVSCSEGWGMGKNTRIQQEKYTHETRDSLCSGPLDALKTSTIPQVRRGVSGINRIRPVSGNINRRYILLEWCFRCWLFGTSCFFSTEQDVCFRPFSYCYLQLFAFYLAAKRFIQL